MADLILVVFTIFLISLNVIFFTWSKKEEVNLMVSGLILMALAPFVNFAVRAALLHFVDWSPEDTREGVGYGAAILALTTFINGVLLLMIGLHRWLSAFSQKNERFRQRKRLNVFSWLSYYLKLISRTGKRKEPKSKRVMVLLHLLIIPHPLPLPVVYEMIYSNNFK
ncbi:hypothetical protein QWY14_10510 [Planococcus sp. N028]|uniref:Uncharacterized protein n=1 Tax=Planococcus shixiaomingii TaxID=3058393 RepID=A0ABT8N2W4_9BACL|nr:hypothetical protein [Planococcus sp. N028]MDN7242233.1 hypothetical protein [Planococcus sp. N028]